MKFLSSSFIVAALLAGPANAAEYGMAGCGLGSIVAKELGWGNDYFQIFVGTTNGTAGSQTFGITTGTSNCGQAASPGTRERVQGQKKAEQKVFLHYNLAQIRADAARGDGEYIAGLADLFGCRNQLTGSYGGFATMSQRWHERLFNSSDPEVVHTNFEQLLAAEPVVCA